MFGTSCCEFKLLIDMFSNSGEVKKHKTAPSTAKEPVGEEVEESDDDDDDDDSSDGTINEDDDDDESDSSDELDAEVSLGRILQS